MLEKEFNIYRSDTNKLKYSFRGVDLLQVDQLNHILLILGNSVQSSSPIVLASIFSKYYSSLIAAGSLYSLTCLNRTLPVALDQISLEINDDWNPILRLHHKEDGPCPTPKINREKWREKTVYSIFAENIQPVFQMLANQTGIRPALLWANASFTIHYYFEKWISEATDCHVQRRIYHDFTFVTQEAKAELFGVSKNNPLNIRFENVDHPLQPSQSFRLRKICCLRYQLPHKQNCTTCPRLTPSSRREVLLNAQE